jgi:hypothetical protein
MEVKCTDPQISWYRLIFLSERIYFRNQRFIRLIHWFANITLPDIFMLSREEVYIDQSGNTKLVLKVDLYRAMYFPVHFIDEYIKTWGTSSKLYKDMYRLYHDNLILFS